jgi:cell division protein FtsL
VVDTTETDFEKMLLIIMLILTVLIARYKVSLVTTLMVDVEILSTMKTPPKERS